MKIAKIENELTIENILQRIDEWDIFRYYIGSDLKVGRAIQSPLRKDSSPSFTLFLNDSDHLKFKDFAVDYPDNGPVDFVMELFGLNYYDALLKISSDFGLGLGGTLKFDTRRVTNTYEKPIIDKKRYSFIQVKTKKFTSEALQYWNGYLQDISDLKRENIYQVKELWLNRKRFPIGKNELVFGYLYDTAWKIYMPERKKGEKWLSNVPLATPGHLENLKKDKNSLVVKSLKDYMVCRKVYENTCYIQNESLGACTEEIAEQIRTNSKEVYFSLDSDSPGKEASLKATKKYKFKHINTPDYLLQEDIKDWADWAKVYGLKPIEEHFIKKGLI